MDPASIIDDIKRVKIQGAENVARQAIVAIREFIQQNKGSQHFLDNLLGFKKELIKARPTEPCLRNAIKFVFYGLSEKHLVSLVDELELRILSALIHFEESENKLPRIGAKKIRDGMVVFTHCHSSSVVKILIEAKEQGKNFTVHNTETRPLLQGRKTSVELAAAGIAVVQYVDAAARLAIKKADLMLVGADAITTEGRIINKIGSELFAEVAHNFDVPVYSCTNSWKFDPHTIFGYEEVIEERKGVEVWKTAPKGVKIDNHAFEIIKPELVLGIISDLGIYSPEMFVQEVKEHYDWMFK